MSAQIIPPQPLLKTTIPSYLYKQYQDDDDLLAFVASYNAATQTYVDWFTSVNLPFYPALSGALLDWVATGLYGLPRTSLTQTITGAIGPLNTAELNTIELNSFTPPTTTYYSITDDIFKRILTWNYYKGDGKRFCMKWLKRRIMRFLLGTNGLEPNPLSAGFVIGPENTQAISVTVASDVLTVTINSAYISSLVQLQPNILDIFKAAFLGGVLDLPVQYTYAMNVVTHLTATAAPQTESVTGIATTLSTGVVDVSALGGNGAYTFAWSWSSGGAGITINSPTSPSTSFTATGITRGATLTGTAVCTVTDSASNTASAYVTVTIKNISAPSVTLAPTTLSTTGTTSSETTGTTSASVSGGQGPYSYLFTWQSGGAGLTINSPTGTATSVTASSISPGQTLTGTLLLTVTDSYGQTATATCAVTVARATLLSAAVAPTSLAISSSTTPMTTGSSTVTASGGQAPYHYAWTFAWTSHTDGASYSIGSASSATTNFTASGMSAGNTDTGTATCTVTDALGQTASVHVGVSFTYLPPLKRTYTSGSGTETVPNGYSTVEIEVWGGGGGGAQGAGTLDTAQNGAGAGAGGYTRSGYAVSGGETLHWSVGSGGTGGDTGAGSAGTAGGNSVVSSGSLSITTMTGDGGQPGTNAGTGFGLGGSATGGNQANVAGGNGTAGGTNTGAGGVSANGVYANNPATNGNGGNGGFDASSVGSNGAGGLIVFRYS